MATNSKEKQREYNSRRGQQAKGWAGILYPDSAVPDWREQLRQAHIEVLISPLHDKDVNANGDPKKPHYHVMLMFPTKVGFARAKVIWDAIGAIPEKDKHGNNRALDSIKAYARYLVHIDDHDKYRYNEDEIEAMGGAVWSAVALSESEETDLLLDQIEEFIEEFQIVSFAAMVRYARENRPEWKKALRRNTIYVTNLIKSTAWVARLEVERECKR